MNDTIEYLGDVYAFVIATPQRNYEPARRWYRSAYGDFISIDSPWDYTIGNVGS